jgi:hypothetical protein
MMGESVEQGAGQSLRAENFGRVSTFRVRIRLR